MSGKNSKLRSQQLISLCIAGLPVVATTVSAQESLATQDTITVVGKQQTYFSDTNTTALKTSSSDAQTPYVVSSTNDVLMKDIRARNLEDIFSYTVGVNRASNGADGFVIRGFDIDLNNIKVNGMSGLTTRFGSPSTANIEAVEVLKGPASVLYGNMESGGMVNMISKKPEASFAASITTGIETFTSDSSSFGDDNGVFTTLDITGPVADRDDLFYRVILTGSDIDSFRGDVNNEEYYAYGDLLWDINEDARLSLGIELGKQEGSADHGLVALNNDIKQIASVDTVYQSDSDFDNDKGQAVNLHYEQDLENGQFNFKWRSAFHEDERRLYENNRVNDAPETLRRRLRHQQNTRDWHGFDTYLTQQATTGEISHEYTLGLAGEYRLTDFDRVIRGGTDTVNVFNPVTAGNVTPREHNHRETEYYSYGFYAQDKVSLTDALTVVASARYNDTKIDYKCLRGPCSDNNSTNTSDTVGSLGVVYSLDDNWTAFGSLAQSFDPYTAERVDVNGNALKAEESQQVEVGVSYQAGDALNISLSTYKIVKENVSESLGGGRYETVGEVESKGAELDIQWLPTDNWQIKAGYAYNNSAATEGENAGLTPAHAPQNSAFLFTRYNLPRQVMGGELGFTLGVNYRDEVKTSITPSSNVTLPSYTLTDVGVHFARDSWDASLTVSNLFDKKYFYSGRRDTNLYAGDPRKIALSFTHHF